MTFYSSSFADIDRHHQDLVARADRRRLRKLAVAALRNRARAPEPESHPPTHAATAQGTRVTAAPDASSTTRATTPSATGELAENRRYAVSR